MAEDQNQEKASEDKNPFRGAEAYRRMVGEPDPSHLVQDPDKARVMAEGSKHLEDAALQTDQYANMRHDANVVRLKADRLAGDLGEQYDKTQAGETTGPNYVQDPDVAHDMADAARKKMDKAISAQDKADFARSVSSENQAFRKLEAAEGKGNLGFELDNSAASVSKSEKAQRLRAEADQAAEAARAKAEQPRRSLRDRLLGRRD